MFRRAALLNAAVTVKVLDECSARCAAGSEFNAAATSTLTVNCPFTTGITATSSDHRIANY